MSDSVNVIMKHEIPVEEIQFLPERLSQYSLSSKLKNYPNLHYFYRYRKSLADGICKIPSNWLGVDANYRKCLDMGYRSFRVVDGLGLEITVYKDALLVERIATDQWTSFVLDPLIRLDLRKNVSVLAQFLNIKEVIYISDALPVDLEEVCSINNFIAELEQEGYTCLPIQTITQAKSRQSAYEMGELGYYIDQQNSVISPEELLKLSKFQLSTLILGLDKERIRNLIKKFQEVDALSQILTKLILEFNYWKESVLTDLAQEITQEQKSTLESLSNKLDSFIKQKDSIIQQRQPPWEKKGWESIQELAEPALDSFNWDSLSLDDWIKAELL